MLQSFTQWEGGFLLFLQEHVRGPVLNHIMQFITSLGNAGWLPVLVCLIFLCVRKYRKTGAAASLSLVLDFALVNLWLKNAVARTRPFVAMEGLELITRRPRDFSFPSGHTGVFFAVASVLFLTQPKKIGVPAVILAALVGFSRLYVGAHYPTDVLGGAVIGCFTGWAAWRMVYRRK